MGRTIRLHDIAHARSGDKGDTTNICIFPYDDGDYDLLVRYVSVEVVAAQFSHLPLRNVRRYEVPSICGLNFVLEGTRPGGVSAALELDAHGKSLAFGLLALELDVEP